MNSPNSCERINMGAKCKIFMTHLTLHMHLHKNMSTNKEYINDQIFERTNVAVICKCF